MTRLALLLALPLLACGDNTVADNTNTTGGGGTSTGDTTALAPTTGAAPTTSTSSSGSDSATSDTSTTSSGSSDTSATSTSDETTATTQGVDATSSSTTDASTTSTDTSTSTSSGSSSTTDTTGAPLDPPMPAGICNDGQGPLTSFVEPTPQPEELHIIGVYQATDNVLTINIDRADIPLTLVLSAYEPVKFTLVLAPGVLLEHVILNGYNPHSVEGQGDAMVTDLSDNFDYIVACGYFWPDNDGGCDTPGLVAGAEALTGLQLAAFVGCYEGSSFTID